MNEIRETLERNNLGCFFMNARMTAMLKFPSQESQTTVTSLSRISGIVQSEAYRIITELEIAGLIELIGSMNGNKRDKYYKLTEKGNIVREELFKIWNLLKEEKV